MEDRFTAIERQIEEHEDRLRAHGEELARLRISLRDLERMAQLLDERGRD